MSRFILVCVVLVLPPVHLAAQPARMVHVAESGTDQAPLGPRSGTAWPAPSPTVTKWSPVDLPQLLPGLAIAASLVLPGSGQLLLGRARWAVYAGLELAGWLVHLHQRREGHKFRTEYRDLAWMEARSGGPHPRIEGDWEYYERLGSWSRSGSLDADPARAGVQPEVDPESFNGATWALARDIYLPEGAGEGHPAYGKALEFYETRAYPTELLWDWTGKEASLTQYRDRIERSDEALRTATVVLGAVVANHLLSAVDAFVSSRLPAGQAVSASAGFRPLTQGPVLEWTVEVRP